LRILGRRGRGNIFYVYININSPALDKSAFVRFVVDTGAAITSMSRKDTITNDINIFEFEKMDDITYGVGGKLESYILPKCKITFLTDDGDDVGHIGELDFIQMFHEPKIYEDGYNPVPSLLGIDILEKFKISFKDDIVILEKELG
jgi:hypothetical protein